MNYFNDNGMPTEEGVYLVKENGSGDKNVEVDVYAHPIKGLCCYADDLMWFDVALPDEFSDGHVSVYYTELEFIKRVGRLKVR